MKIVALSDTHCVYLDTPPAGDILAIAGDVLYAGNIGEFGVFYNWLEGIRSNYRFVVFVPGNHDRYVEENETLVREELSSIQVDMLIDQEILYKFDEKDIRIYGSPWIPQIGSTKRWAYEIPRLSKRLEDKWDLIPPGLDLLITHGPPYNITDNIIYWWSGAESDHWGCELMRKRLETMEIPPKHHVFGHIHDPVQGKHMSKSFGTEFHNVAICDENYNVGFDPKIIEI